MRSIFLACGAAVLLAACAQSEWVRQDTDEATLDQDLQSCQQRALVQARKLSQLRQSPTVVATPQGGAVVAPPAAPAIDPAVQWDALLSCMREKGYQRSPQASR
jgi:hypothetical protein